MTCFDLITKFFDQSFASRWTGLCGGWTKELVIAHSIMDFVIWFAYMTIPIMLLLIAKNRNDIPFNSFFFWFAVFIVSCGFTHLMNIITSFSPLYYMDFWVKTITAVASAATAWLFYRSYY